MIFRTSNPTLKETTFENNAVVGDSTTMTLSGTIFKTVILTVILIAAAGFGWMTPNTLYLWIGLIGSIGIGIALAFKPMWSPVLAPMYSVMMGLAVGTISWVYNQRAEGSQYENIVPLAIFGTMITLAVMLGLYSSRIIKVTQTFRMVVLGATAAVGILYLCTWLIPALQSMAIFQAGTIGIVFSVGVIVLAAMNLALDFKLIEDGVAQRSAKYMEWYAGFALLVTIVWIYIEILRLLDKLRR